MVVEAVSRRARQARDRKQKARPELVCLPACVSCPVDRGGTGGCGGRSGGVFVRPGGRGGPGGLGNNSFFPAQLRGVKDTRIFTYLFSYCNTHDDPPLSLTRPDLRDPSSPCCYNPAKLNISSWGERRPLVF